MLLSVLNYIRVTRHALFDPQLLLMMFEMSNLPVHATDMKIPMISGILQLAESIDLQVTGSKRVTLDTGQRSSEMHLNKHGRRER